MGLQRPLMSLLHSLRFQRIKDFLPFYVSEEVTCTRVTRQDILRSHLMCYTEYMSHLRACRMYCGASQ